MNMLLMQAATEPTKLTIIAGWVVLGFLALLAIAVLYYIFTDRIDLSKLISEPNGDASMSRFQLLIFTFVIGASLFLLIASSNKFPDIPQNVLLLLGISSSSYLVSKGIQFSAPEGLTPHGPDVKITNGGETTSAGGKTVQFTAKVVGLTNPALQWSLDPATGMGTIDQSGLYTPPPIAEGIARPTGKVSVKATSVEDGSATDTASVTLV